MLKYMLLISSLVTLQAAAQKIIIPKKIDQAMSRVDTNDIRGHIAYLADDRLQGRLPGTEGYRMAVDYVVDQFRKMGMKPGSNDGSFTQKLVIRKSTISNPSCVALLKDNNGNSDSLAFLSDYTPNPHPLKATTSAEGQLIFVGYGIDIPGVYSDYTGVDVKGKIAVMLTGAPEGFSSTVTAHLRSPGNKMNIASTKGAAGVIIITSTRPPATSHITVQTNAALNPGKTGAYSTGFNGNLAISLMGTQQLLNRLFMNSGRSLNQVLADLKNRKPASFDLPYSLAAGYNTTHTDFESYNVVGLLPGSDKKLQQEYVVHSAHLDHLGIGRSINGDSIYNGAHDNASGVASLLEIAKMYKRSGAKPKRSILIVMVTGEEMGLLGSSYFAANPTIPKGSIVADVNTDMPTIIAPLLSVVPLGAEHSSLMNQVKSAAGYLGLDVEQDPEPTEFRFVRSDQYSFVRNGIPALHIKYGSKSNIPGFNLVNFVKQWREQYYHKPADGMNGIFNFTAAKTYVQLNFLISYLIAQTIERPVWNEGDTFGASSK